MVCCFTLNDLDIVQSDCEADNVEKTGVFLKYIYYMTSNNHHFLAHLSYGDQETYISNFPRTLPNSSLGVTFNSSMSP